MKDLIALTVRVFNDVLPTSTDVHFLYSQTPDNEQSVIEAALKAKKNNFTNAWLIMQTKAISGYEGFEVFSKSLIKAGISETHIMGAFSDQEILHTLIESMAVVSFCKERGYKSLLVSAAPFQQVRAFMTAVTAAMRIYPTLKIYSLAGKAYDWNEKVIHSQGKTTGTRAELINGEIDRIGIYGEKGDILKVPEVHAYLDRR